MADLTLERIAELRVICDAHQDELFQWTTCGDISSRGHDCGLFMMPEFLLHPVESAFEPGVKYQEPTPEGQALLDKVIAAYNALPALLDAAERGLTQDRKAAAFDRMAEFTVEANDKHDWVEVDFNGVNFTVNRASGERDYAGKTLLEAVEQLPTIER